jgi:3-isopropylmalate dehydrogenase
VTRIAVIPGDGIGVEVTREAVECLEEAARVTGRVLDLERLPYGAEHYLKTGETLPDRALDALRECDSILLGALGDPRVPDNRHAADILLGIRFRLDLYVNQRPVRLLADPLTPLKGRTTKDIDFVIFRENTEGLYVGVGGFFKKGTADEVAVQEDINTRKGVERIIRHAFDHARRTGRKRVLMSDKSNALIHGHDLWQRVFREVARDHPGIEATHMYVDALAMQMIKDPSQFDVIVTCNMFGDILSDLGAQIQGGLGLAASGNLHPGRTSLFEPVHGSAPKYAGRNVANPVGCVLSAAMMLQTIGLSEEARLLEDAVTACVVAGRTTRDLGGDLGTREVGEEIRRRIRAGSAQGPGGLSSAGGTKPGGRVRSGPGA